MARSGSLPGDPPPSRDADADCLKAVNTQIADRKEAGLQATPYLLVQKAELEHKLGIFSEPVPSGAFSDALEHAAADPLPEHSVPRKPGRPRKNPDADSTSDS